MGQSHGDLAEYTFWHTFSDDDKRAIHEVCRAVWFDVSSDFDTWLKQQNDWIDHFEQNGYQQTVADLGDFLPDRDWLVWGSPIFEYLDIFETNEQYNNFLIELLEQVAENAIDEINARIVLLVAKNVREQGYLKNWDAKPNHSRKYEILNT